jgi:hypothetical protein
MVKFIGMTMLHIVVGKLWLLSRNISTMVMKSMWLKVTSVTFPKMRYVIFYFLHERLLMTRKIRLATHPIQFCLDGRRCSSCAGRGLQPRP